MSTVSKNIDRVGSGTLALSHPISHAPSHASVPVALTNAVWPTADFLMSLLAAVDRPAQRGFDVGDLWRRRAMALDDGFVAALDHYGRDLWINLLGLPADLPEARTTAGFVEAVAAIDPIELLRHLTGFYRRCFRRETPADVMDAAIHGDRAARREFRRTSFADLPPWRDTLRYLLGRDPAEIQTEFAELVGRWHREVYGPTEEATVDELEQALQAFQAATDQLPVEQVVERAAPGLTFVAEAGQTSVVLLPAIAIRPAWAVTDHRASNVFAFPASRLEGRPHDPPARLVMLGKAIGDETRLRILRELAAAPLTPPALSDRLGIPRTTLLHHLRILRLAGLIAVRVNDSAYHQYHVRDEHFGEIERLLEDYLR
jgi:DNA-binding transcriptional ArsR family regulator